MAVHGYGDRLRARAPDRAALALQQVGGRAPVPHEHLPWRSNGDRERRTSAGPLSTLPNILQTCCATALNRKRTPRDMSGINGGHVSESQGFPGNACRHFSQRGHGFRVLERLEFRQRRSAGTTGQELSFATARSTASRSAGETWSAREQRPDVGHVKESDGTGGTGEKALSFLFPCSRFIGSRDLF